MLQLQQVLALRFDAIDAATRFLQRLLEEMHCSHANCQGLMAILLCAVLLEVLKFNSCYSLTLFSCGVQEELGHEADSIPAAEHAASKSKIRCLCLPIRVAYLHR